MPPYANAEHFAKGDYTIAMSTIPLDIRTWAEIDMSALLHNFKLAQSTGKKVMCVIKADAYGHGALRCGQFLEKHGADAFAVGALSEALDLRNAGIRLPLLILGYTPPQYAALLAQNDITQSVLNEEHAIELNAAAKAAGVRVKVHIKLDTGMSRVGLLAQGEKSALLAAQAAERICALPSLCVKGMFTHFSVADTPEEDPYTAWQLENFEIALDYLTQRGLRPETCHAGNSACILDHPETHFDMVRAGIMLYGLYPDSLPREDGPLRPVMTLKSRVALVRSFPAGASVSYGRAFTTDKPLSTAIIEAGYADGHPRRLSNRGFDTVNGRAYPQIGRICMDMHMIDVSGHEDEVHPGDEVILWGGTGMSAEAVSQIVGTISYELICLVTARATRVYLNEDI